MKKGCFLKFIIIFTILVAVILYIVQNKFEEYVLNPGKEFVLSSMNENWDELLDYVKPGREKDSLQTLIRKYVKQLDSNVDDHGNKTNIIIDQLRSIVSDSTVDASELLTMRKIISESEQNGESKKN